MWIPSGVTPFSLLRRGASAYYYQGSVVVGLCRRGVVSGSAKKDQTYVQGQYSDDGKREYFYHIDHQGMLFLTETKMKNFTSCFKDKHFLRFFFKRVRINNLGRYDHEFPFVSHCGSERNYVRCEDTPVVFTEVLQNKDGETLLSHNHAGIFLTQAFRPELVCMLPETGRVYHPASENSGGFGLIADKLSILWTEEKRFVFGDGESHPPTSFVWKGAQIPLNNQLLEKIRLRDRLRTPLEHQP